MCEQLGVICEAEQPGVKPATYLLQVPCPNHSATTPHEGESANPGCHGKCLVNCYCIEPCNLTPSIVLSKHCYPLELLLYLALHTLKIDPSCAGILKVD